MTGPIGFSSSLKRLESGWALGPDQEQFHERLRQNLLQLDAEVHHQFSWDPASSFGLHLYYFGGIIDDGAAWTLVPNGSLLLTDDAVSYIERDPNTGAVTANVVGWTYTAVPMALATTKYGRISSVADYRPHDTQGGGGSGGTITFPIIVGSILDYQVPPFEITVKPTEFTIR